MSFRWGGNNHITGTEGFLKLCIGKGKLNLLENIKINRAKQDKQAKRLINSIDKVSLQTIETDALFMIKIIQLSYHE